MTSQPPRLLINTRAGRGRARRLLEPLCRRHGIDMREPDSEEALTQEARGAVNDGLTRLLVAGGDGTIRRAVSGLRGSGCALGIIPLGTGNDLARALGVPLDPQVAVERALVDPVRRIDVGQIDGRPFTGVAAAGVDGEVLEYMRRFNFGPRGPWLYPWALVRTLVRFVPPAIQVTYPDGAYAGPITLVGVANSPLFGGGMRIAPQARLDDGTLDLVIIGPIPKLQLLRVLPRIYSGTHIRHPAVQCHRVSWCEIQAPSLLTVHGDGEPLARTGNGAVRVDLSPGGLKIISRQTPADRNSFTS